ncbi:MAG: hypothetical protein ACYDBQ_12265 [Thermoplasmatota archaeon]
MTHGKDRFFAAVHEDGAWAYYSPLLNSCLYRYAQTHALRPERGQESKRASTGFELLVSHAVENLGATTTAQGRRLVGVSLRKNDGKEVDVLAWTDDEVYLIESKYEQEPPGAWDGLMPWKRGWRRGEHERKHESKVAHWEARIRERKPVVRVDNKEVHLPESLLETRRLKPLIASARPEPRRRQSMVVSAVPKDAADFMRRRLPLERFAPIWPLDQLPP